MNHPIYPCLWFDGNAREAADFYCSIFKLSSITSDSSMVVLFQLNGNKFMALNGGPKYHFTEAISFVINCDTQEEIDHYWSKLSEEGQENKCGWLKDKFGISWQIVPTILGKLMADEEKRARVMEVMLQSVKFNIQQLLNA
jgi:predicted 3-demethylubiquinone-9 3-methyltransferase (glyoxalase superfamily)